MPLAFRYLPLLCLGVAHAGPACPPAMRVGFPDVGLTPLVHGSGSTFEQPPGELVAFVRQAVAQSGCSPRLHLLRRPLPRLYQEAAAGQLDWVAFATHTPQRAKALVFPKYRGRFDQRLSLYAIGAFIYRLPRTTGVQWDGQQLQLPPGGRLGVAAGSLHETLAREQHWPLETANGGPAVIAKLRAGRTPAILVSQATVLSMDAVSRDALMPLPPAVTIDYSLAAPSHRFYRSYPQFSRHIWLALCRAARAESRLAVQMPLPPCPDR